MEKEIKNIYIFPFPSLPLHARVHACTHTNTNTHEEILILLPFFNKCYVILNTFVFRGEGSLSTKSGNVGRDMVRLPLT